MEMKKTTDKLCRSCIYSCASSASATVSCNYLLITGKRRGCKIGECDKYEKGKRKKTKNFLFAKNGGSI